MSSFSGDAADQGKFAEIAFGLGPQKAADTGLFSGRAHARIGYLVPVSAFDSFGFIEAADGRGQAPVAVDSAIFTDGASVLKDLGRIRRGDKVRLSVSTLSPPDGPPVVVILDGSMAQVFAATMPAIDRSRLNFALPLLIGIGFALGSFTVYYHYSLAGVSTLQQGAFTVIPGGDSGGSVISLCGIDRTESLGLVAQIQGGQLVLGRNPSST